MSRKLLGKTALCADLMVSVFLALALLLTLPASAWTKLAPQSVDQIASLSALDADQAPQSLPSSDDDGPRRQPIQLFEDDVLHEDHVCVAPALQLKVVPVIALRPDSPHTARLERPPMGAA